MRLLKHLRLFFLLLAVVLGALDSWTSRHALNAMGVSYLDMGDAMFRGDWSTVVNGFWSPLYSLPLGLAMWLIKPSPAWEFAVVHLVNYLIYLCALFAFDFWLRELIRFQSDYGLSSRSEKASPAHQLAGVSAPATGLPESAWLALGYTLFIWCSLSLITMATTAPDLLLSVFVYLALALLFRIRRGRNSRQHFFVLGLILGVGYLAKAPMLPLSFLFLLIALSYLGSLRKTPPALLAAVIGFALSAGPFIAVLSVQKGHFTAGESGKLNYLWHVNNVPFFHWQGGDIRYGVPEHPTRRVFENPAIYEFATPLKVTYSPWYDPSYWYAGAAPRFHFRQQISALKTNARVLLETFSHTSHLLVFAAFALLLYQSRKRWVSGLRAESPTIAFSMAAFAMYAVIHVEPRYLAPFIPGFWLGLFCSLRTPARERSQKLIAYTLAPVTVLIMLAVATRSARSFYLSLQDTIRQESSEASGRVQIQVSDALNARGIKPGDAVGFVNFDTKWIIPIVHWARLAHVYIVAEMPSTESAAFLASPQPLRNEILEAFAKTGAKVIIAGRLPAGIELAGWERIGNTDYYLLKL